MHLALTALVLMALSPAAAPAQSGVASLGVPPTWQSRLAYYQSFETPGAPDENRAGLTLAVCPESQPGGAMGQGGFPGTGKGILLRGEALSPHQPLVISFWWRLLDEADKDTGALLLHLTAGGGGFISHFARTGPWCALKQAAAVLQVYHLPGIQNINGIYDYAFYEHLDLAHPAWRHTALVITGGSMLALYTDGQPVYEVRTTGRCFAPEDRFRDLVIGSAQYGPRLALDEIMILNRPLAASEIAEYVAAVKSMAQAGYWE